MAKPEKIVVLDFGGQYNPLIARRVRESGVYCEILNYAAPIEQWRDESLRGIILTGGMAYSKRLVRDIEKKVCFIAPVVVSPGENEMKALAGGAARAIASGEIHTYQKNI